MGYWKPPAVPIAVGTRELVRQGRRSALEISDAAVKQHLLHLYDKFAVYGQETGRRTALANEAVRRGAVTLVDLHRDITD